MKTEIELYRKSKIAIFLLLFFFNFILSQSVKDMNWESGIYSGEINEKNIPDGKGIYKIFEDGKLVTSQEGVFANGELNGVIEITNYNENQITSQHEFIYKNGEFDGSYINGKMYENNLKKYEYSSRRNSPDTLSSTGYFKKFDDKGDILEEWIGDFYSFKLHGKGSKKKYKQGKISVEQKGNYVNHYLNGDCEFVFYSNFETIEETNKGKCIDDIIDGRVELRMFYDNGDLHFETIGEMKDGDLIEGSTREYKNGKLILNEQGSYNKNKLLHGKGKQTRYADEKIQRIEGDFVDGKPEGIVKLYNNNRLFYDGEFHNGNIKGKGTVYNYETNEITTGVFENDQPVGEFTVTSNGITKTYNSKVGSVTKRGYYRPESDAYEDGLRNIIDEAIVEQDKYIKEGFSGKWKKNPKSCKVCNGTGIRKICSTCSGKGKTHCYTCNGKKYTESGRVCLTCEGKGLVVCSTCHGKGKNIRCNHELW